MKQGIPVLGCEPSCLLTLRDDYLDLVEGAGVAGSAVQEVASNSWMVDEFLVQLKQQGKLNLDFGETGKEILFHGHCHQKAHIGSAPSLEALRLVPGLNVSEVDSGCCGMAGLIRLRKRALRAFKENRQPASVPGRRRGRERNRDRGNRCFLPATD